MSDPHDLDGELQQHALALRAVARDLVRDGHAAEDVTQEAFCQAIARRDLEPGPLGGWLYRTVVNFARQWRRQQARRTTRLVALPEPEPTRSSADVLTRAETLQAVTQAVLALDEPYQTAILLRYFENLPPRTIAARTNCNLATVKSRLARGLAQLRNRLDRQCRGDRDRWRLAMVGTFGLPTAAAAAGITFTAGLWIMGTTTKTLAAAGLLFAGGLLVYTFGKDPAPPSDPTRPAQTDEHVRAAAGSTEPRQGQAQREQIADSADTATDWLNHAFLLELEVRVVDPAGLPVKGRSIRLAPSGCTLDNLDPDTDANGVARLQWPSRLPSGEVILTDPFGMLHKIPLQHGVPRSITLGANAPRRGAGEQAVTFRVTSKNQLTLSDAPIVRGYLGAASNAPIGSSAPTKGMHPFVVFASSAARVIDRGVSHEFLDMVSRSFEISFSSLSLGGKAKDASTDEPPTTGIAGTVFGEDGAIAKSTLVALFGEGPQPVATTATDDNGQFSFDKLLAGEFTVRAGGDAGGVGTSPAITTTGVTPVTVNLRRETFVRGRAQTADGAPVTKATVQWFAEDGTWWDSTETGNDGTFVLANLPNARGTVLLLLPDKNRQLPVAAIANVLTNTGDLILEYDPKTTASLRFDLVVPDGIDAGQVGVRLWNETLGLGVNMVRPEPGKPWVASGLTADWYRVDVFVPGCGWLDLGKHWIDAGGTCDLGMVTAPSPCLVEVRGPKLPDVEPPPPPGVPELELYAVRADVDLRLRVGELTSDCDLRLPAGDYALARRDAAGIVHFHRFTARRGETVRIDLPE